MRDHVLLQTIAHVSRPYEDSNDDGGIRELVRPHRGFRGHLQPVG
jgi:hypothetical protein